RSTGFRYARPTMQCSSCTRPDSSTATKVSCIDPVVSDVPEGDTIHRTANRLRPALVGQQLVRFEAGRARGRRPPPGTTIDAVEAVGKHLLIRFAGGITLRTHMRMTGSWHLYRTGERWRQPRHL